MKRRIVKRIINVIIVGRNVILLEIVGSRKLKKMLLTPVIKMKVKKNETLKHQLQLKKKC